MCDFASGWIAGMVGVTVGHPMDTVKVNQQTQGLRAIQCTKNIYNDFGVKGYFRGLAFPVLGNGAIHSLFFGVYRFTLNSLIELTDYWKRESPIHALMPADSSQNLNQPQAVNYWYCFLAGSAGGLAQVSISCPVELIKIKLQTQKKVLPSDVNALQSGNGTLAFLKQGNSGSLSLSYQILRNSGIRGIYQGAMPMLFRDVPSYGLYMVSYELLSGWTKSWSTNEVAQTGGLFVAGGIAGTIAWWSILPLDTIKSRIQADESVSNLKKYKGTLHCSRVIFKEQGIKGFFRGFWAMSLRAFPVNGATFITLEWLNYICRYTTSEQ